MGKTRAAWQELKKQLEVAPKFGKAWVSKNFKQDLGPTMDEVEAFAAEYVKESEALLKQAEKLMALREKGGKLVSDVNTKVRDYGDLVKQKSKEEKTEHGKQIDDIFFMIKKVWVLPVNDAMDTNARSYAIFEKLRRFKIG